MSTAITTATATRSGEGSRLRLLRWGAGGTALLVLLPVAALLWSAAQGSGDLWPHLIRNVLPRAMFETLVLALGVGVLAGTIGTGTAWLVATCRFPGRGLFEWALLLPLAIPTYIQAFVYVDAVHPLGPIPTALRALLGLARPRDLWLPEVRSLPGCIVLLGLVLYPYVYLTARAAFLVQGSSVLEASRMLGAGATETFLRIALPLARPAIAVGVTLVLMETVNDVGASEFLGVQTLTLSIYSTWLNRSSLPGAAQIALFMLAVMFGFVLLERWGRRHLNVVNGARARPPVRRILAPGAACVSFLACLLPVVLGFLMPAGHLLHMAWQRLLFHGVPATILQEAANTALFAAIGTALALGLGLMVAVAGRTGALASGLVPRLASLGYAIPGTVLAVGLLVPLAGFDNLVSAFSAQVFGHTTGLLLSGSGAALIIAYVIRFLAIPVGGLEAGYGKIGTTMDMAARSLGERPGGVVRRIHLPLLRPALGTAALLVFVDCMKELPATLMLRPLNFETLASHVYGEAARGTYEDGALAALLIVLVGLVPVILLARLSRPREG
ncbi:iron(III) transport system permease protein [Angulomicrobium tetraedrale]|uniref:Iron(III) transport system permease protein n=1 Tax=Ancylobacter tetraedralis TaxID=217068 RepID=A0A839Z267_9HYPH|nr:iron ABC transporter permease [Ancylobacter tetraedralis]MBB3769709.1 iron(III) transport system permease protein [Ancylobacter tetraedralis]